MGLPIARSTQSSHMFTSPNSAPRDLNGVLVLPHKRQGLGIYGLPHRLYHVAAEQVVLSHSEGLAAPNDAVSLLIPPRDGEDVHVGPTAARYGGFQGLDVL